MEDSYGSLSGNVTIETLKELDKTEVAKLLRKLFHKCRKQHKVIDCPSCLNYETVNCFYNQLFGIKPKRTIKPLITKRELTYAEKLEKKIDMLEKQWKEGKLK